MKLNRLETHDRLLEFKKQSDYITQGCEDCIKKRPMEFRDHSFYIYAHARTHDDGISKRLIWQPRLSKPKPETNSMLFKHYPKNGDTKIMWIIPEPHLWPQYRLGNVTENKIVLESIDNFKNHMKKLSQKEPDDLEDWLVDNIYIEIASNMKGKNER
jgi:hypothetical protein